MSAGLRLSAPLRAMFKTTEFDADYNTDSSGSTA